MTAQPLTPPATRPPGAGRLAANRLGTPAVVCFVLAAATPLTVVAGVVPTGFATTGLLGLPVAFATVGLVLAVFSVGYIAMARQVGNAGAFSSYLAHGLGRPIGVAGAWVALAAYNCLQVGLYGAIGAAVLPLLGAGLAQLLPWWLIALAAWAITALLGVLRVDVNGRVLAVLLLAETGVILGYSAANLAHPAGGQLSLTALNPSNLIGPGAGAILVLGLLGFIGFEAAVVFSEEVRAPKRVVPRATYTAVAVIATLYTLASWAITVAIDPERVVATTREQGTETIFTLAAAHLGPTAVRLGQILFATSLLAAMIAFHNTTSRYLFALGREGVLPRRLGATAARTGSPRTASLAQSTLALLAIVVYAIGGWDPLVHLFYFAGTIGGLGVLLLITTTALAVIVFFARHPGGQSRWRRLLAPILAAVALLAITAKAITEVPTLLGVPTEHPLTWLVPVGYLALALVGIGWGLWLRSRRPQVYARIGLGAKLTTPTPTAPLPSTAPAPRHSTATIATARMPESSR